VELSPRKMRLLQAIIDDYISTAVPVGSRTVSKKYMSEFSAATIRNEMSDLEEMGFLEQPHTSAGRIPSDLAYRVYVDRMLKVGDLTGDEAGAIRRYFNSRMEEMEQVVKGAARVLSDLTDYTSMVLSPQLDRTTVKRLQLVPVTRGTALVVLVTDAAVVKDTIIRVPDRMNSEDLHGISEALTHRFEGKSISEINVASMHEILHDMAEHKQFFEMLTETLSRSADPQSNNVVFDGAYNIFHHPEYRNDMERAQSFLMALETKDKLQEMMTRSTRWEFTITIGRENEIDALRDMSVVTATYKLGDRPMGSLGVIGPTRMDYSRVVRLLNFISRSLGEIMSGMLSDGTTDREGNGK
jgi:heat-inducible transcriptional repressor